MGGYKQAPIGTCCAAKLIRRAERTTLLLRKPGMWGKFEACEVYGDETGMDCTATVTHRVSAFRSHG